MAHVCCLLLQLRSRRVLPYAAIIPFSRAFAAGKASHFQLESAREIRWHVRTACECTVIHYNHSHWVKHVKLIYGISVVSRKHPEDSDWYENFLMDLVTFKNVQKQNLGAVANYQLVVRTASRSDTTATFLLTSCSMCQLTQSADFLSSQRSLGIRGWTGQTLAAKDKLCYKGKLKKS